MSKEKNLWPGWETVRLIGRGSFGAVYEIERDVFGHKEKAALKVITIPQSESEIGEMYDSGYDEASVTATFKSRLESIVSEYSLMREMNGAANVVNCDDFRCIPHDDNIGWDVFIRMELLTPLTKTLDKQPTDGQVTQIAKDMCNALTLCRKYGIIHRDIKPQNIFVSRNGDYKLGDFGIARVLEGTTAASTMGIGTYKYMAPEVLRGVGYDSRADIYSLGLVLHWLLNERRAPFLPLPPAPVLAGQEDEARNRRFGGEPLPAPAHGSEELKRIVLKACAYDPKNRYQSAEEMLRNLNALGEGRDEPVVMPLVEEPENDETISACAQMNDSIQETDYTIGLFGKAKEASLKPVVAEEEETVGAFPNLPQPMPKPKPKKKKWPIILGGLVAVLTLAAGLYFLPGWTPATCDTPETHKLLGITRGEALGHEYGEPSYIWSDDYSSITATRICKNDADHVETETVKTASEVTAQPECEEKGITTYTSAAFSNRAFGVQMKEEANIDVLGHTWREATYTEPETCERCGKTRGEALLVKADTAGAYTDELVGAGFKTYVNPFVFDTPIVNCKRISIQTSVDEVMEGSPYGIWKLFGRTESGAWITIGSYYLTGEEQAFSFEIDAPITINAVMTQLQAPATSTYVFSYSVTEAYTDRSATGEPLTEFRGHRYEALDVSMTWTEAKDFAEQKGGHLAVITSEEEEIFIERLIADGTKYQYWLGACRNEDDISKIEWVTGENFGYTNWESKGGEPNNYRGNESYVQIYRIPNKSFYESGNMTWNDASINNTLEGRENYFSPGFVGLIIEYES